MDRGPKEGVEVAGNPAGPTFVPFAPLSASAEPEAPAVILNVNDDDAGRYALSLTLRRAGLRVEEAATAADAFRLLAQKPDLIILDVDLPDQNGFEVCRRIKENPTFASIPVLQLSAKFVKTEDKVHGLEGGADGYLAQPFEPPELVATVKSLLRLRRAERQAEAAASQWQATFEAISDGVCLVDGEGRVLCSNGSFGRMLGLSRVAVGKSFLELFLAWSGLSPEELSARQAAAAGAEVQVEGRFFHLKTDPVRDGEGRPIGAVHVLSEVTDRQRAEAAERTARVSSQRIVQLEQEIKALEGLGVLAGHSGVKTPPLSLSAPDAFADLAHAYGELMDLALEQRHYKVTHNLPARIDALVERLGGLRAGPRDVIEMHNTALAARRKGAAAPRLQAYLEEGRFLLLELMGGLVHQYRRRLLEGPLAAEHGPTADTREAARE